MAPGAVNFPPLASYGLGFESIKPKVSAIEFQKWSLGNHLQEITMSQGKAQRFPVEFNLNLYSPFID